LFSPRKQGSGDNREREGGGTYWRRNAKGLESVEQEESVEKKNKPEMSLSVWMDGEVGRSVMYHVMYVPNRL
jgi:hypothetical protein